MKKLVNFRKKYNLTQKDISNLLIKNSYFIRRGNDNGKQRSIH